MTFAPGSSLRSSPVTTATDARRAALYALDVIGRMIDRDDGGRWLVDVRASLLAMRASPDHDLRDVASTWHAACGALAEDKRELASALFSHGADLWLAAMADAIDVELDASSPSPSSRDDAVRIDALDALGRVCRGAREHAGRRERNDGALAQAELDVLSLRERARS
jgi:hypothetical protein